MYTVDLAFDLLYICIKKICFIVGTYNMNNVYIICTYTYTVYI